MRPHREHLPNPSDERECCEGLLKVMPDGSVKKNGKACKAFTPQNGRVLYAFASHNGAGFVTYAHLNHALYGVHTVPSLQTQDRLRVALSRTKQVLVRNTDGWSFVEHNKCGWTLERLG